MHINYFYFFFSPNFSTASSRILYFKILPAAFIGNDLKCRNGYSGFWKNIAQVNFLKKTGLTPII